MRKGTNCKHCTSKTCTNYIHVIMNHAEHPQMYGLQNSMCARTLYESEIVTSLLSNSASWIGLTEEVINTLQDFQNTFMLRFFEAPKQGTPTGIVELDSNMLLMKNRIMLSKLTYVGKVTAKSTHHNMCRNGKN